MDKIVCDELSSVKIAKIDNGYLVQVPHGTVYAQTKEEALGIASKVLDLAVATPQTFNESQ